MRALFASLALVALLGCGSAEDAKKGDEIAALKKRITKLENRVRKLESRQGRGPQRGKKPPQGPGRGKARPPGRGTGPAPAPTGPIRLIELEGDARAVMLVGNQRRFKLPGKVPAGKYNLLVAFGEAPLGRKGGIMIPEATGPATLVCEQASDGCTLK